VYHHPGAPGQDLGHHGAVTYEELALRAEAALARPPRRLRPPDGFARAAVLVTVLRRPGEATLLFTHRADALRRHAGEIAFAGGRLEGAEDARAAALREAHEEVALDADRVRIVGELDDRPTSTGFVVTPVVGLVAVPPPAFSPDRTEIQAVLEIPFARLAAPGAVRFEWWPLARVAPPTMQRLVLDLAPAELDPPRQRYKVYFFDVGPVTVWGLTARIVKDLVDRLG
jgi:8-oxo-dGTP pyrophosphatase MutT (NUDIX family)